MHPAKWKKPCGARLFGQRKNANLCIKISVLLWRSGWDSNPRTRKGQQISSLPRYDRFDTTPYISSAVLSGKSERTTGENRLFNSSLSCPQSLAAPGFSRSRVPRGIHDFAPVMTASIPLQYRPAQGLLYYMPQGGALSSPRFARRLRPETFSATIGTINRRKRDAPCT